ncbi:EEF1A lysine methyltransferase 4 like protein [Verticillium longisporum]|uniref:EEF1A lysine methyltransferase 4 like protein n=1 Tax=Verticillium longisporum TaxID=100787 RepID=A0A8I2Z673_VERLO|nr:EEF1A lysine methyltransferase 4 like protein [Verticillium longisporum]
MMSNEELEKLAHPEFWDERYSTAEADTPTHEWFRTFDELLPFLEPNLFGSRGPLTNPKILHLGSGDSTIPRDLAERGYSDQLCVDFSNVVVDLMSKRHGDIKGIEWRLLDVCNMDSVTSGSIDVAFDKGTLDAMIHGSPWSPPQDVVEKTAAYIQEVSRVLKNDGVFLYVTYRPQHFIMPRLNCPGVDWDIKVRTYMKSIADPRSGRHVRRRPHASRASLNMAAFANKSKTEDDVTEPQHPQTTDDARLATENGGDRLTAAYREALESFNKQAVEAIQQADGMGDLIKSLDQKRDELQKNSWFHRGLDLLDEPLRKLDLLLPLGKAFASLDPTTATAFGIVATVIGIAVGACGAVETIKDNIQQMLDYVPMIYQCDALCEAGGSEAIHQALVKVYKELIEFYLVTSQSLRSSARATIEQLGGELAKATGRFNAAAERLARTISIATHQKLQQIDDLLKDHHVGNLLDYTKFKAIEMFHFEMEELRADQASI